MVKRINKDTHLELTTKYGKANLTAATVANP